MTFEPTELLTATLAEIPDGRRFTILKVRGHGEIRQRLIDLGFVKNEKGIVLRQALLKDPIEIEIRGTRVSLRRSEARLIDIEVMD